MASKDGSSDLEMGSPMETPGQFESHGKKKKGHRAGQKRKNKEGTPNGNTQLYEIRPSPGKGRGVFTLKNIKCGTRIICEESIMNMEPLETNFNCSWRFLKLSPENQEKYLSLQYKENKEEDRLIKEAFLAQDEAVAASMILSIDKQVQIARIYGQYGFKGYDGGTKFCVDTKLINHCCIANVEYAWNPNLERMTVHAVKDIVKDEELFFSYVPAWYPREQRLARLRTYFGFYCDCVACDITTDAGLNSAIRRERLHKLATELTIEGHEVNQYRKMAFHSSLGRDQYSGDAIPKMMEVIKLVEKEGIGDMELTSAYRNLGMVYERAGNYKDAAFWLKKATGITKRCMGEDHCLFGDMQNWCEEVLAKSQGRSWKRPERCRACLNVHKDVARLRCVP